MPTPASQATPDSPRGGGMQHPPTHLSPYRSSWGRGLEGSLGEVTPAREEPKR